ncbi:MAG: hypothetical protein M3220_02625, partial [Chloroflexota bacterium]|nr:hypothetical protein [Chloroflexota bacterium]
MSSRISLPSQASDTRLPALHLELLGPPQIRQGTRPLVLSRQQVRLLLYRLGLLEPVSRDELAFLFWPDVPDATARRNLT